MSFRQTIKREAKRQGMSGYRLGKLSGVPMRTVQRFLSGATDLTAENLEAIAKVLGLTLRASRQRKDR